MTEAALDWIAPSPSRRGGYYASPRIGLIYSPEKHEGDKTRSEYYRLTANRAFMDQYFKDKSIRKISFSVGSKGPLFIIDPDGRKVPHVFRFNKGGSISDPGLVRALLNEFGVTPGDEYIYFKLSCKPAGTWNAYTLYKLSPEE